MRRNKNNNPQPRTLYDVLSTINDRDIKIEYLKNENARLQKQNNTLKSKHNSLINENRKTEAENALFEVTNCILVSDKAFLIEKIDELKSEIKNLKQIPPLPEPRAPRSITEYGTTLKTSKQPSYAAAFFVAIIFLMVITLLSIATFLNTDLIFTHLLKCKNI